MLGQVRLLRDALQSARLRLGCLLGAGCPSGIYGPGNEPIDPHIPDVARLTEAISTGLKQHDTKAAKGDRLFPCWEQLLATCSENMPHAANVEHVLSELRTLTARRSQRDIDGWARAHLVTLDRKVCDLIAEAVDKPLPKHWCAYHRLALWVGGIRRHYPVEIFTPNYDLLLEEAFESQRIPHFDGFVGSREPFFDLASIEQDSIPTRWTRLWKLHGSINWQQHEDGGVFRAQGRAAEGKAMIYPSHLKYDQSRRMPYLAMIDRLKEFFRSSGTDFGATPPVLITCGYSFSDDHINEILLDGLRGNQSSQCFAMSYKTLDESERLVDFGKRTPNLTVLARDGAIIGTRQGQYAPTQDSSGNSLLPEFSRSTDPKKTPELPLGDFHHFTLLLEQLHGGRGADGHVE
jgi:hypothetical protein